jgi:hypothetical protein
MRRLIVTMAIITAGALAGPAVASAALPAQDSVVGVALQCSAICTVAVNAHSGPSGENATGTGTFNSGNHGLYLQNVAVTCLAVSGNEAVVGLYGPNLPSYYYPQPGNYSAIVYIQDNVPPTESTGDAVLASGGGPTDRGPTQAECASLLPIGRNLYVDTFPQYANFTIVDAKPLPTSKDQCKNGGWRDFGVFKNQGDCVSFVATGGKNPPGK